LIPKRNDYIALYVRKDDAEKLFQDLAEHLGVEGINRRGVKTDIIHFSMRFTLTVLNAIGSSITRDALIGKMKKDIGFEEDVDNEK